MMNHWKIHLAWAVATPVFAICWGRWSLARQEPDLQRRELAIQSRTKEPPARPSPPSPAAIPVSIPKTLAAPMPAGPVSEEQAFVDEIRRLLRSEDKGDPWEANRRMVRIPPGPLKDVLLLELFACKDANLRRIAIEALAESLKGNSVPLLMSVLGGDSNDSNRMIAAEFLGTYGGPGTIDALLQACHDSELAVQIAAANSLKKLGQPAPAEALVPRLARGLSSPDGGVRREAIDYISNLSLPSTLPILLGSFRDPDGDVRDSASRGVARLNTPGLFPILEGLLKDPDPKVVEAAENAIARTKRRPPK